MSSYVGIEIGPQPPQDFIFGRCGLRSKNGQIPKYTFLLLEGAKKKYASQECISILTICSPDRHDSVDFLTREEIKEVSNFFLAVQDSSIGDIVSQSVSHSLTN